MTPTPPPSPEGSSLPPRHRPTLGSFNQDTTELDLWSLEDDGEQPAKPQPAPPASRASDKELPGPRANLTAKPRVSGDRTATPVPANEERIRINVNQTQVKSRPAGPFASAAKPEDAFDDLEQWDDDQAAAVVAPRSNQGAAAADAPVTPAANPQPPPAANPLPPPVAAKAPQYALLVPAAEESDDEFSPVMRENAVPVSLRPHLRLSATERLGLIVLLVLMLAGAAAMVVYSLHRLPTETQRVKANDFPITGDRLTIASATSYWRAPIISGTSIDTVRRGTQLLPVLEISVTGGPAAIRVLFRNEDRVVVGDAVTRLVRDAGVLKIPATAGFDDQGMHAAYRTGESKPWTIEVLEAPSEDVAGTSFKHLCEMNISTDLH